MNQKKLWEILVPRNDSQGAEIPLEYHKQWDAEVLKISGGLTIQSTVSGQWVFLRNQLLVEPMIPVRIMCTEEEIIKISDFTAKHYEQKAIMLYKISDCVYIREYT